MPRKSKDQIFNETLAEVVNDINDVFAPKKMKKITPEDIAHLPEKVVKKPAKSSAKKPVSKTKKTSK